MECQSLINEISNHVRCCPNGFPEIQLGEQYFPPDYIASKLLQSIKEDAEGYLGQEINSCVIASSGPVTHFERIAFMDAAAYAGMSVSRIVSSSSAYTLYHGMNKVDEKLIYV